jgi:hypothetical protein
MSEYGPCAAWQRFGLQQEVEYRPAGPEDARWAMSDLLALNPDRQVVLAPPDLSGDIAGMAVSGWKGEGLMSDFYTINASTQFIFPFVGIPEDKWIGVQLGLTRVSPGIWAVDPAKQGGLARLRIARFVQDVFVGTGGTVSFEHAAGPLIPSYVGPINSPVMCLVSFLPPNGNWHPAYY